MKRFIGNIKNDFREQNLPEWLYNFLLAFIFEIITAIFKIHAGPIAVAVTITLITTTIAGATTSCVK